MASSTGQVAKGPRGGRRSQGKDRSMNGNNQAKCQVTDLDPQMNQNQFFASAAEEENTCSLGDFLLPPGLGACGRQEE